MKIIDAFTGEVVTIGKPFRNPEGGVTIVREVHDKFWSATALFETRGPRARTFWMPLTVRFLHPSHLFQRVAFVNS
jgi:hypothetical protein